MKLDAYLEKRDPNRTNEPFGAGPDAGPTATEAGAFVIHLHDATRRHYDLRLEVGGVLASFAIPRGPSLDPSQKHLAVHTEDHPIEYLDFEDVIPEGNYGAGPMILWDRGRVRFLDGPAEAGIEKGKLDFELYGLKVRGRFALVRLKGREKDRASASGDKGAKNEWLFFKKQDAHASTTRDVVTELPRSVLSGLTVEELAEAPRIAARLAAEAAALGAPVGDFDARKMVPMLCAPSGAPERGEGWLYELKLDGVRVVASRRGPEVTLTNRKLRDETGRYPEVVLAMRALAPKRVVLDGEVVAFDESGRPNFQRLGHRMHLCRARDVAIAARDVPVVYVAFDLLALEDRDLRPLPLVERKRLLRELLRGPGVIRALDHLDGDGTPLLGFCREHQLEGVVAKRASSPYRPGPSRGPDWVKMKCEREADFVVIGFTSGEGGRGRLGALDLATWSGGELVYRGKVGSGLDERTIEALLERLRPLATNEPSAKGAYVPAPRGRTHVRPGVVVGVRFLGWSDDAQVRHPVFRGIRDDVDPAECVAAPLGEREEAMLDTEPEIASDESDAWGAGGAGGAEEGSEAREAAGSVGGATGERARSGRVARAAPGRRVSLTNPDKVLWPEDGYRKRDLFAYYGAVAPVMLPHLRDRPVVLVRYPDGIAGKWFYQWNAPPGVPPWMRTQTIAKDEEVKKADVFLVDDAEGLQYLANLACIPIHVLASRSRTLDQCDFLTIDFDVKNGSLADAVRLAGTLRELLDAIGLAGFPKTSGQSGLHVLVPLGPGIGFPTARALADLLGRLLVQRHPDIATMERIVAKRGARVYVDTGQTGTTRTIVAPYSVRATPGARVSAPLAWDEVTPSLDPGRFTIATMIERIAEVGDPMAPMLEARPDIPGAVARLEALLRNKT